MNRTAGTLADGREIFFYHDAPVTGQYMTDAAGG